MTYEMMDKKLKETLSPKRYAHSKGVEETAEILARIWGADVNKAKAAGLLHDLAKNIDTDLAKNLIGTLTTDKEILSCPGLWHGIIGASLLKTEYDIDDPEIFDAVYYHTTGKENMSLLCKIIYVADLIEPGRDSYLPWAKDCRKLAEENIDKAVLFVTDKTIESLISRGEHINPLAIKIHNFYLNK